jgi:hypothetical protein
MEIEFTRINNDINGNPRYVCHFLNLLTPQEKEWRISLISKYVTACKRANKIGGRKYHTKSYGGGIVFQSYSLDQTRVDIARALLEY